MYSGGSSSGALARQTVTPGPVVTRCPLPLPPTVIVLWLSWVIGHRRSPHHPHYTLLGVLKKYSIFIIFYYYFFYQLPASAHPLYSVLSTNPASPYNCATLSLSANTWNSVYSFLVSREIGDCYSELLDVMSSEPSKITRSYLVFGFCDSLGNIRQ
jgi:hypothetical protein